MALKPKARPAPRAIMSPAVCAALFSETRKASSLARRLFVLDHFRHRRVDAAQDLYRVVEVVQDRVLHARRFYRHHLGKAAVREQSADAFEISGGVGEAEPAPPERSELGLRLLAARSERLGELLVAHQLDAGGEGLEQIEGHLFRCVVVGIIGSGTEKRLLVGRTLAPSLDHVPRDAIDIGGDAEREAAAEGATVTAHGQGLGTVAIEQIFEGGETLQARRSCRRARRAR